MSIMSLVEVLKKIDKFTVNELYEVQDTVAERLRNKNNENKVTMLEVVIDNFCYAVLREDELDLALEVLSKHMRDEKRVANIVLQGSINLIGVPESEVEDRRFIF